MGRLISLYIIVLATCHLSVFGNHEQHEDNRSAKNISIKLEAESSQINSKYIKVVEDERLSGTKGVALEERIFAAIDGERDYADLTFNLDLPEGRYVLTTYAITNSEGAALMRKATSKYESMYMRLQVDDNIATKRVIYVPWDRPRQESGKFTLGGKEQELKIWLPRGVILDYIQISTHVPPPVPETVSGYNPPYTPPSERPRLWVNPNSLETVKNRLTNGENKKEWESLKKRVHEPYKIQYEENQEVSYNGRLETTAREKAFYYLMTNDTKIGRESIDLMTGYLSRVEFGNLLDITREIGRAIYTASLVYDWCYDIMKQDEKDILYEHLMRLADDMEVGWPPFKQSILTGHGSEAQITRDLLSMSIAIYEKNPLPFKYCSYRILEELVPMRNWQYQSPRHNQGINYAAFRSTWDMHAAWLFYRMTGKEVFDANIKKLPLHWLYTRLPNGEMLRDGDGSVQGRPGVDYYWRSPQIMFLFYTYAADPVVKAEFVRQGGKVNDAVLYLLLNDPNLEPEESLNSLPLTIDFGPIIGSMIARTGWNMGKESDDVVAEIKGGGYHFGNHQHSDAGALQLYYRGIQVADIGIYGFYGTPYDLNFNKRSISHSMMLVVDPDEKFGNTESNDGGTKFNQRHPTSVEMAKTDPWFNNGTILSTGFGPSRKHPVYSYFAINLKGAYSSKIDNYIRQFCFINLENDSIPAVILLSDKMITTNPDFKKYWQINTLNTPSITEHGFTLENNIENRTGKTHVQLLFPSKEDVSTTVLSGDEANSSFGFKYEPPGKFAENSYAETRGYRIMVSPAIPSKEDNFLTFFQVSDENILPLKPELKEFTNYHEVSFGNYTVCMNKGLNLLEEEIFLKIPPNRNSKIIITGVQQGDWNIQRKDGKINWNITVFPHENTIYFQSPGGEYLIAPKLLSPIY